MTNLIDLTFHELEALVVSLGEPPYRARQVWQWLWQKGCCDLAAMTDVSKGLRARLAAGGGHCLAAWSRGCSKAPTAR